MKTSIGVVVVACAAGCGTERPDTGQTTQAVSRCPDPEECVLSNGGGVYTEELGDAGIGPFDFMITHFITDPTTSTVSFQGRAIDPTLGYYTIQTGTIDHAHIAGYGGEFTVNKIVESLTMPTFTVTQGSSTFDVSGDGVLGLRLVVTIRDKPYTITFTARTPDSRTRASGLTATVQMFDMYWAAGDVATASTAYCTRAPVYGGAEDPVVFQQGLAVNPLTAVIVTRNANFVTLSCRHGAIATTRWWGYVYRGDVETAQMFETAMHMKRASYCGDYTFYTRANTDVLIDDTDGVNTDAMTPMTFEASWGVSSAATYPIRALCVNMDNRRHPNANFPPNPSGSDFDGTCADGTTIDIRYQSLGDSPCPFGPLNDQHAP
jgi:hypothetical protein